MIQILARAKVNLNLHITGRRDDGYHLLSSLVVFPEFGDVVEVERANETNISFAGPFSDGLNAFDNSAVAAINDFRKRYDIDAKVDVRIEKNIPVMGGLGGGTADAAAVYQGLRKLYKVPMPDPIDLVHLGADVPASAHGRSLIMEGIGEEITNYEHAQELHMVLINPRLAHSTAAVFSRLCGEHSQSVIPQGTLFNNIASTRNDMQEAAIELSPKIREFIEFAKASDPIVVRMTGSGASVYALTESKNQADALAGRIKNRWPYCWVKSVTVKPNV